MWGHEVRVIHDGRLALGCVSEYQPEVVMLDVGLPGLDGIEVAERLRECGVARELTLIAVSGYSDPNHTDRALRAGIAHYFTKPVDPEQLRRLLECQPAPGGPQADHPAHGAEDRAARAAA